MSEVRFPDPLWTSAQGELLADQRETCAVFYTRGSTGERLLVQEGGVVPERAYVRRTRTATELSPEYLVEVSARARRMSAGVVLAHTHPFDSSRPVFSAIDDAGEAPLRDFFAARLPERRHLAMVVSPGGVRARALGAGAEIAVLKVGRAVERLFAPTDSCTVVEEVFDRQVRAFGNVGQREIGAQRVGIIGLGGTGSVVAQELALLGVKVFVLVDPDLLETTNRNRVFGSQAGDVGRPKVEVAADNVRRTNPEAVVEALQRDVLAAEVADRLCACDMLFLCTDSHASRALVSQLAYQHLIPAIDMGVSIGVDAGGAVREVTGRVQMLAPGLPCLLCTNAIDPAAIRLELMSDDQRRADPYFRGEGEPQPAVASLNATVASLAVTMFLGAVTGAPLSARHQWYDGLSGRTRTLSARPDPACMVCSATGAMARGCSVELPMRGLR